MLLKTLIGAIALFLILFGIHWVAILIGVVLSGIYYLIPVKHD